MFPPKLLILFTCIFLLGNSIFSRDLPSSSPQSSSQSCPKFSLGFIYPPMTQNYIAVAKYGNSSITYWKTSWLYFDMKVSFMSNGSWKSFYYKSETDVIYTNCGIIDTNSCHSIVAVRFLEGLLQVQCSEWADNPSIIFSIDVTSNETFTNYTDLLHTMLYGYTKEY